MDRDVVEAVAQIIATMSFKGAGVAEAQMSLEDACVRDADRLDAIGAIALGIGRTFAFGGWADRPMHDPERPPTPHATVAECRASASPTINHFLEKLLLLADRMAAATGKEIARGRHAYTVDFLARFDAEWNGEQ